MPVFLIVILVLLLILVTRIRIVQQARAYVIERVGAYKTTWGVGIHFLVPFIERVAKVVSLKEQVADFPPQPVITKDNVTMQIDTVVYNQAAAPEIYTYGIEQPMIAIENLSATTLRNIIGELELDECLTSRDVINTKMRSILDDATDPWGIKVNRVELKNILPPEAIRNAMEKQMKAERERREAILRAEGEKQSAILEAEGEKEAAILRADAKKQQQILEAQPKLDYLSNILANQNDVVITEIAKDYGMSGQAFNKMLNKLGIQYKANKTWVLYAKHDNKGYTNGNKIEVKKDYFVEHTVWTPRGRIFIYDELKKHGILPLMEK